MAFRVEFNHETSGFITVQEGVELEDMAKTLAQESLQIEGATFARVVNEDSQGEVWSVRKNDHGSVAER